MTSAVVAREPAPAPVRPGAIASSSIRRVVGLVIMAGLVGIACVLSVRLGTTTLSTRDVIDAFVDYDPTNNAHLIVRTVRVPRTVLGIVVGAALGVTGAVMQAATRNGLADPGILGINSGAALAAVVGIQYLGVTSPLGSVGLTFVGALGAAVLVYVLGSVGRSGLTSTKLALAGVVVTSLLSSWLTALMLSDDRTYEQARFWLVGSLQGRDTDALWTLSPFFAVGIVVALVLSRHLDALALGDDVARSLGQRTGRARAMCGAVTVILAGSAVAVAGPIGFVGLAVPHFARAVVGASYSWILPYSMLGGALLLVVADTAGRLVVQPSEFQVGIVTALVGAPVLIVLVRRGRTADL